MKLGVRTTGTTALLCLVLSACFEAPTAQKKAMRMPDQVCKQVRDAIEKLGDGAFQLTKPGEAVMPDQAWLELQPEARDQLAQLIGYDAACHASEPSLEHTVVIRSEVGRVITERTVETSPDLSTLLKD